MAPSLYIEFVTSIWGHLPVIPDTASPKILSCCGEKTNPCFPLRVIMQLHLATICLPPISTSSLIVAPLPTSLFKLKLNAWKGRVLIICEGQYLHISATRHLTSLTEVFPATPILSHIPVKEKKKKKPFLLLLCHILFFLWGEAKTSHLWGFNVWTQTSTNRVSLVPPVNFSILTISW